MTTTLPPPKFVPEDEREAYKEALRKMGIDPDALDALFPPLPSEQPSASEQQPTPPKK